MTKDYSITWFYVAKTLLMFSAVLWASCIGEDIMTYAMVGILSMLAVPFIYWLESK
jgi:hypothetical protein